ncbi:MerR family DNA-binding transcriptional regulator [Paenibacillus oralis]|uniref:MerR family DNA-binding transcriptional regulator n=1 Tax=Paenibacillus oralis TaxID=2490856 RepID=A0A3P3U2T4_9BACL|nr:helix-turn-helix domain-containing protein [Paenibacillus oralis]RRJ64631.1 MerR family DNA-binding transcriptional regulator [Paenibacillus oralis]
MDNKRYFSIGEVSRLKNVTIKALRYYHDIGLLIPAYTNPDNGYRYYTMNQFIDLDIIKICKQSNVGVKEIKALFAKADTDYLKLYLEQKNEEIHKKIKKLEELNKRIEILKAAIHSSENELMNNGFKIQTFEKRYFLSLPTQGGELNEIKSFDKLDEKLGEFSINTFQYGLIYSCHYDHWEISDVFRLITSDDYRLLKDTSNVSEMPKGEYLTINCTRDAEMETFQSVKEYLEKNSLKCNKVYMFYLVADVFNQYNHFSQFQISLKPTP